MGPTGWTSTFRCFCGLYLEDQLEPQGSASGLQSNGKTIRICGPSSGSSFWPRNPSTSKGDGPFRPWPQTGGPKRARCKSVLKQSALQSQRGLYAQPAIRNRGSGSMRFLRVRFFYQWVAFGVNLRAQTGVQKMDPVLGPPIIN